MVLINLVLAAALVVADLFVLGCSSTPTTAARQPVMAREGCQSPIGFIAEGKTATGYLRQVVRRGESCQQGVLTCENGTWTGAYIYPSCVMTP